MEEIADDVLPLVDELAARVHVRAAEPLPDRQDAPPDPVAAFEKGDGHAALPEAVGRRETREPRPEDDDAHALCTTVTSGRSAGP